MARLDQLNLDPSKEQRQPTVEALNFIDRCNDLLDDERFQFASKTLTNMRDWLQDNPGAKPTENMWVAVENIEAGGRRHAQQKKNWERRGGSRRYEGFK